MKDEKYSLLGLPYLEGGELYGMLKELRKNAKKAGAAEQDRIQKAYKFYAANVMLGLQYLHENGIIYKE